MKRVMLLLCLVLFVEARLTLSFKISSAAQAIDILDNISQFNQYNPEFLHYWKKHFGLSMEDTDNFLRYVAIRKRYCKQALELNDIRKNSSGVFVASKSEYEDPVLNVFFSSKTVAEALNKVANFVSKEDCDTLGFIFEHYKAELASIENRFDTYAMKRVNQLEHDLQAIPGLRDYWIDLLTFYGFSDSITVPIVVNWWPRTRRGNSGAASMAGEALLLRLNSSKRSLRDKELMGVMVHELVHAIESRIESGRKRFFSDVFIAQAANEYPVLTDISPKVLYEPLAVALGQILFMKRFFPNSFELENDDWYANPWINSFAQELFPLVESYMKSGKSMDGHFMEEMARIYVFHRLNKFR